MRQVPVSLGGWSFFRFLGVKETRADTRVRRLYPTYQRRVAKFWPVLTPLKGAWLALSGARRGRVERAIWGAGAGEDRRQGKLKQK